LHPSHINAVIENELVKHKISIEDLFRESEMNKNYVFPKSNSQKMPSIGLKKPKVLSGEGIVLEGIPKKRLSKLTLTKGESKQRISQLLNP
jgi:hypothetical protein